MSQLRIAGLQKNSMSDLPPTENTAELSGEVAAPPPIPLDYVTPVTRGQSVRKIALRQRELVYALLFAIISVALQVWAVFNFNLVAFLPLFELIGLGIRILVIVFIFRMALALYSTGLAVVLGIISLIPLIGLITLLIMNTKATRLLREAGIHVGLMGAKRAQIPPV
jgi:hypothetical protein